MISSIVTGGSHLLCAMLEQVVWDMGGQIAAMYTDSAMIVADLAAKDKPLRSFIIRRTESVIDSEI